MLTIHMKSGGRRDPVVSQLSLTELFRTVRVFGEVPFIEPSSGMLLNLTHVERIYDEEAVAALEDERERTAGDYEKLRDHGTPLPEVGTCLHGYVRGTCSRCASPAERDEWGTVSP